MSLYAKKSWMVSERVYFNPKDRAHRVRYARFLKSGAWGGPCPFYLEEPYKDIPSMVMAKVAVEFLSSTGSNE